MTDRNRFTLQFCTCIHKMRYEESTQRPCLKDGASLSNMQSDGGK